MWSRDDPMHNVFVPEDECVAVPTLWVVELFPPSAASELRTVVKTYDPSITLFSDDEATTILSQSRAGRGYDWFRLAWIKSPSCRRIVPDARVEPLPDPFWGVELTTIQLGTGLTAVVAQFHFTEGGASSLDREWHRDHEPRLRRRGNQLIAEDRQWSAYGQTQEIRREPHDKAREWMVRNCPGYFAQSSEPQPLLDLLVVEKHDPTDGQRPSMRVRNALRALGLTGGYNVMVSSQVPKLVLAPAEVSLCPALGTARSWTLWGNRAVATSARSHLHMYNGESDTPEALGHAVDDEIRDFLLALSVSEMAGVMREQYAKVRDTARRQHDSFSSRYLQRLRRTLLTLSIDLASAKVDVRAWWERHSGSIPHFIDCCPEEDIDTEESSGFTALDFDFTLHLQSEQASGLAALSEADHTIRDILSTVASLGAARDTHKVGLMALGVAGASLLIAAATLLVSSPGPGSIASHVFYWLLAR
jgi:hypothetical protein